MSPNPDPRIGTTIGHYRLDRVVGRGGMGTVYQAFDTVKERTVALKILHPSVAAEPSYVDRFRREQHLAASLNEPHVIPIHDFGEIDGVLFIDMRLVEGSDLKTILRSLGSGLPPHRAVAIIEQVAAALDAAHAAGLIHRDVKPENILVTAHDFAYLCDFGIAVAPDSPSITAADTTVGSFSYMAPERCDDTDADYRSDVYSLACVLYEALTGSIPHPATSVSRAIKAHLMDQPPSPSAENPDVPAGFDPVVAHGLAKSPAARPASAGAFAAEARAALAGPEPTPAVAPPTAALPYDYTGTQYQPPSEPYEVSRPPQMAYSTQPAYGGGYAASYPAMPVARRGSGGLIAAAAIATVMLLGIAALLVWYFGFRDTNSTNAAPVTSTQTVVSSTPQSDQQSAQTTPSPQASGPPEGTRVCSSQPGVAYGTVTAGQ